MTVLQDQVLLSSGTYRAYAAFWKAHLALDEAPYQWLLVDGGAPSPPTNSTYGAEIDPASFKWLERLAGNRSVAQFTIALAALRLMVRDESGPFVVRLPHLQKGGAEPENPWLFLQLHADTDWSLKTLLNETKHSLKQAYESAAYPLAHALGDSGFEQVNQTNLTVAFAGLHHALEPRTPGDVVLTFHPKPQGLSVKMVAGSSLDSGKCNTFMARLNAALACLESPEQTLETFSLVKGQLYQQLAQWSQGTTPVPRETSLPKYLQARAKAHPDASAVWFDGQSTSYADLDAQAHALAHNLSCDYDVHPGDFVCLFVEPSPRMVIGMLACLKLGAAFVPLDPKEPGDRLDDKMNAVQPKLILTDSEWMFELEANCAVFALDLQLESVPETQAPLASVPEQAPAYLIFTSGSSGKPKAVVVPQRGICSLMEDQAKSFRCMPGSRVIQFASYTFDASISEIFVTLGSGATLYLAPRSQLLPGPEMQAFFAANQLTIATLPPAVLRLLDPKDYPHLQTVVSAGEACDPGIVTAWSAGKHFINAYGPTEASVCATLTALDGQDQNSPPIGKPFGQQNLWIINRHARLVAPGVSGEIGIGGALAWGYWNQPALTASKFVPHPFAKQPGARLYKSGDLGHWLPQGDLAYLGRVDFQVKIRGFRIELEEIERACLSLASVKNAVVQPSADFAELHAYLVPHEHSLAEIGGHERYALPNGMAIAHHQKGETDFIYGEVFEKQLYGTHHLKLQPGDCVFDVGANIGLFSLYAQQLCHGGQIFAFEPMPPNFERLSINTKLYGPDVTIFNCGLGEVETETQFAFYPKSTGASGRYTDQAEEEAVVRALIRNQEREQGGAVQDAQVEELVGDMFEKITYDVQLRRLSDIIREQGVTRIDLLKIDVEKSEWDVLQGLEDAHWPMVQQVVLEVHDLEQRLNQIETLLKDKGFQVVIDQDSLLQETNLYNIYAVRQKGKVPAPPTLPTFENSLFDLSDIAKQLGQKLPHYMIPNLYHVLDALPLNSHGKIARDQLSLEDGVAAVAQKSSLPQSPFEEMVLAIFDDLLPGGLNDVEGDFFAHGGHSLIATQVISRVRDTYKLDLPLRSLFSAPTPVTFAKLIETELNQRAGTTRAPVSQRNSDAACPLSLSQRRLWVLDQLEPGSSAYNVPFAFRLTGQLHVDILNRTLNAIIERHEVLRSAFPADQTPPIQVVTAHEPQVSEVVDFSQLDPARREEALRDLQIQEAKAPFSLEKPPLMRWQIAKLEEQHHVVLLTLHHIVADGWSMGLLVKEIVAFYKAFLTDATNSLSPLALQYGDYAAWQQDQLESTTMANQLAYWQKQLHESPAETVLPSDHARGDRQSHAGQTIKIHCNREILAGLKQLSQEHHGTLFMTLLAAFKSLLHRHTGQQDLSIGTVIAGRNQAELEPLIGYFLNNLVIRTQCKPEMSFSAYLDQVRDTTLEAYTHQETPFEHILSVLDVPRDLAMTPLFQTLFIHQNAPIGQLDLPHLQMEPLVTASQTAKFDLTIMTMETQAGLSITFNYNCDLYDDATMAGYAQQYQSLLENLASQVHRSLQTLVMAKPNRAEAFQSPLAELHAERPLDVHLDLSVSLGQNFQTLVNTHGTLPALQTDTETLTYADLNAAANRVANGLDLPVGTSLGLLFGSEPEMIIAFLGAIKVGVTAVPMDPSHPPARLQAIYADSGATRILTHTKHETLAQQITGDPEQSQLLSTFAKNVTADPIRIVPKDTPLYLLYTSGSTGTPKGVVQTHENALFFMRRYIENLGIRPGDRLSLLSSFTFDAGLMDIFGALLSGAALCPYDVRQRGLLALSEWLDQQDIHILHLVPTLYRQLMTSVAPDYRFAKVRTVVLGGEAALAEDLEAFNRHFREDAWLVNGFGPTESTLALQAFFAAGSACDTTGLPLGQAIEGMDVRLTNPLGAVIEGVGVGELVLSSAHLAQGYHGQPGKTDAAFFLDDLGRRCYRTGDLAKRTASGDYLHTGRRDFQVKIRGHRVEIAEIEAACLALPGVQQAVVHGSQNDGEISLCAYLVVDMLNPPDAKQARTLLTQTLPQYMIPQHFMVLEALPLTVTGKIDRAALPQPQRQQQTPGMVFAGPQTPTEKALATIWQELLKLDMLGIHDNFFSLGAHSLMAIQAILKIRDHFLIDLPLHALFENPTIAGLAEALNQLQQQDSDDDLMQALLDELENEDKGA